METAAQVLTMTPEGQITLGKELREHLGVEPGEKIAVEMLPDGSAKIRRGTRKGSIDDFIGCLASPDAPSLTLEEIKKAIEYGWAGIR